MDSATWADQGGVKKVDCDEGRSINRALQESGSNPITIIVKGTCNESVQITRPGVTLMAAPGGGTINGVDPNSPAVLIASEDTVIDGLTVTGGNDGISLLGAARAAIRNCTVQDAARGGIAFRRGASGLVDNCTIRNNLTGVAADGGSADILNSAISENEQGISFFNGANGYVGIRRPPQSEFAGNSITNNRGSGISVIMAGSAVIGGNTINGNGTSSTTPFSRFGVNAIMGDVRIIGNNTITGNAASGVNASNGSRVEIGGLLFGLPEIANTISGNNTASLPSQAGVSAFNGAFLQIRNATITGNNGHGVSINLRSSAQVLGTTNISGNTGRGVLAYNAASLLFSGGSVTGNGADGVFLGLRSTAQMGTGTTIANNGGHGILLADGSGLSLTFPPASPAVVTGNTLFGLECWGTEASYVGDTSGITGNLGGQQVSGGCTGF